MRTQGADWAATALGPRDDWPETLKVAAGIVLASNVPMILGWGKELLVVHNDSYGEILGDRRPAQGRPFAEIWSDIWDEIAPIADRVIAGETVYMESVPRPLRRQGRTETAWLTSCYNPLHDPDGEIVGIFGAVTSVSSDARTERRIRESEERFRLIADSAPALMWVTKLDRRRNFVNRAYVEFLGITYREAIDFDWREVLHPDDRDRVIRESIAGEGAMKQFALEARYRRHDGQWRWVRSVSQPRWGPGGEHIGYIGVAHDITEAKEAETALRDMNETLERRVEERTVDLRAALDRIRDEVAERQRAEEALRQAQKMEAVGQLTGGIAHDFNNLLTPVIGGLEVLARRVEDPRLQRLAQAALDSSRRGAKLTSQLLAFSRIQRISIAPVAVNEVIGNLRDIFRHTLGSAVTIEMQLSAQPLHGLCDENQLENAILNLAINARDAMPNGGTLTVSTGLRTEAGGPDLEPGDYVCITVADTGTGMSPEVLARATEPFFSTKPLGKGTGLGLAQVHGIARQAGGTLWIESREGEGATVRILLRHVDPGAAVHDRIVEPGSAQPRPSGAAHIMVVDDDADVRSFLGELLAEMGHRVDMFDEAEAALAAAEREMPALALIDFAMPGMNGAELAHALRLRHPKLRVAIITGYSESAQIDDALGPDVIVLRKPFGTEALASLVAQALSQGTGERT